MEYSRGDVVLWRPTNKARRWYLDEDGDVLCAILGGPYAYDRKATTYQVILIGIKDKHGSTFQLFAKASDLRPSGLPPRNIKDIVNKFDDASEKKHSKEK